MKKFLNFFQEITNEWIENGKCSEALKINEIMRESYFDTANPHFFTGDLNAKVVMIQLNPKREKTDYNKKANRSVEDYFDYYSNYGKYVYGKFSNKAFKSKFDQKLIRFLRPLELLDLNSNDIFQNLENVVDQKLQLELIPFGSPNFDYSKIPSDSLDVYVQNILSLILTVERSCVIFGGRVFSHILFPYIRNKEEYRFKLQKVTGEMTKNEYEIEKLTINFDGKSFDAFIAPHFAIQGMPVEAYGRKLKEIMSNN